MNSSSLVALGEGLLLIPKRMFERIQEGDYIDFSELLPAKGKARAPRRNAWEGHILVVQLEDLEGNKTEAHPGFSHVGSMLCNLCSRPSAALL